MSSKYHVPLVEKPRCTVGLEAEFEYNRSVAFYLITEEAMVQRTCALWRMVDAHLRHYPHGVLGHPRDVALTTRRERA